LSLIFKEILMSSSNRIAEQIHALALEIVSRHKRAEADLIEVLQLAEKHQVYFLRGHNSLFAYATLELRLGESMAYTLIAVARKSAEVPALKTQLESGAITLTNAKRVAAVLTPENQSEWIEKASTLSSRELEREIARVRPTEATPERATYVSGDRLKLELGISENELANFKRAQDILCQSRKRQVSLEETLKVMNSEFLERHDPVQKAARHQARQETSPKPTKKNSSTQKVKAPALSSNADHSDSDTKREPIKKSELVARREDARRNPLPIKILHQVNLRDKRRCQHLLPNGLTCRQSRWVEIHHKIPVHQGGHDTLDNLITLCSTHHRLMHADLERHKQCGASSPRYSFNLKRVTGVDERNKGPKRASPPKPSSIAREFPVTYQT
jgi:hypothetical protein